MSVLTPSPPSILGFDLPHPGLAPTSIDSLVVTGSMRHVDLGPALLDLTVSFKIDGTSTLTAKIEDDHRTVLRSGLAQERSVMWIDGVSFVLADVKKTGPGLDMIFEHSICAKLKDHTEIVVVAPGTMTRTAFVRRLVSAESWIRLALVSGESPGNATVQMVNGNVDKLGAPKAPTITTVKEIPESFWESTGRVLNEIGWRRFPRTQNSLIVCSDDFLYHQDTIYWLSEDSPGVDSIDFDYDIRKPLSQVTLHCRAENWAVPVGQPIQIGADMGPATGKYLVIDIERSLMSPNVTVTLDKPQPTLPEPQNQDTSTASADVGQIAAIEGTTGSATGATPQQLAYSSTGKLADFVNFALSKKGGPYVWGGNGPTGYDCSGLVKAAADHIGVSLPRLSDDQYTACRNAGGDLSVSDGIKTFGALLVRMQHIGGTGHIAISQGNGRTIEAMGHAQGICEGSADTSRFDHAAKLPGVTYGSQDQSLRPARGPF